MTTPRSEVTIWPSAIGARAMTRSPAAYRAPPGVTSSGPVTRPWATICSRASRLSSATLARRQANMAASVLVSASLAHRSTSLGQRLVPGALGGHAMLIDVELDGPGDVAGPEFVERSPFGFVVLTDVLVQDVHDPAVPFDQRPEGPTDGDGTQLAVVTHHDHLGPGPPGLVEQEGDVPIRGHSRLVEDQHVVRGQPHLVVLQPPPEGGQGSGLGEPGLLAQGPSRLARGGGADHRETIPLEGVPDRGHDRGLARAGHPFDQLHAPARGGDPEDGRLLAGGQWRPQDSALAVQCRFGHLGPRPVPHRGFPHPAPQPVR